MLRDAFLRASASFCRSTPSSGGLLLDSFSSSSSKLVYEELIEAKFGIMSFVEVIRLTLYIYYLFTDNNLEPWL